MYLQSKIAKPKLYIDGVYNFIRTLDTQRGCHTLKKFGVNINSIIIIFSLGLVSP